MISDNTLVSGSRGLKFKSGLVKSDTMFPKARYRCNVSLKGAVMPRLNDAEMGPANLLHASAYYRVNKKKIIAKRIKTNFITVQNALNPIVVLFRFALRTRDSNLRVACISFLAIVTS